MTHPRFPISRILKNIRVVSIPTLQMAKEEMTVEWGSLAERYQVRRIQFFRRIDPEGNYMVRNNIFFGSAHGTSRITLEVVSA